METLDALEIEKTEAIENLVFLRKNLMADIAGIESEVKTLNDLKDSKKAYIERIEGWIDKSLGGTEYKPESGLFEIKYTKSTETNVFDMDALLKYDVAGNYVRAKLEPDKKAIKAALTKEGLSIPGCAVVDKTNMKIK